MPPTPPARLGQAGLAERLLSRRNDPYRQVRERLLRYLLDTQRRRESQRHLSMAPQPSRIEPFGVEA
ncbi:hypothetical protein [Botrimarina sp.]|uniref:hypothetical protein n=1 Tax=Botrimarina sp. TaxID=2795802 RepID=UPI0032ED526F